jgi:hypothetical protein
MSAYTHLPFLYIDTTNMHGSQKAEFDAMNAKIPTQNKTKQSQNSSYGESYNHGATSSGACMIHCYYGDTNGYVQSVIG